MRMHSRGFTLIEMIVVVAIIAIIVGAIVPNFNRIIAQNSLTATSNELLTMMHAARVNAMKSGRNVIVCPSSNAATCGSSNWATAIMFVDNDRNGQVSGSERVQRIARFVDRNLRFTNNIQGTVSIVFRPNGLSEFGSGMSSDTNAISVCSTRLPTDLRTIKVGVSMGSTLIAHTNPQTTICSG